MTKAREIMSENVEVAKVGDTIEEVAQKMQALDVGALPICNEQGRLQGMVTDRDIALQVVAAGRDPRTTTVESLTDGTEVVTIGADDSVEEAMKTMKEHKVRRLPVIDGHDLVGMVSQADIATSMPEAKVGDLLEVISSAP